MDGYFCIADGLKLEKYQLQWICKDINWFVFIVEKYFFIGFVMFDGSLFFSTDALRIYKFYKRL